MRLLPVIGFLLAVTASLLEGQVFPGRAATAQDLGVATDAVIGILLTNIGATDLTISVSNAGSFQPFNFPVVDGEKFEVCAVSSTALTVCPGTRGLDGTTATSHVAGAAVADIDHSSYHNRTANEIVAIENDIAPTSQPEVNVKTYGCKGDGVTNDQPCFAAAFASGHSLFVPDGSYIIDLTTLGTFNIYGYTNATVEFSKGAKWLIKTPANTATEVVVFGDCSNLRFINFDYEAYSPHTCTNACGSMLWFQACHDIWMDGTISVNAQTAALILSEDQRIHLTNTVINTPTGNGLFATGVLQLEVTNIALTNTGDDAIDVGSTPGDTTDYGATLKGVSVNGSKARCINISSPNVTLSGFSCQYAQVGGVGVEYLSEYSPPNAPDKIVIANGVIQDVRNLGSATDPNRSEDGIYIDTDGAVGAVTISNVIIQRPDGRGVGMDADSTEWNGANGSVTALNVNNVTVENAGNSTAGTLDGTCFYLSAALLTATGNSCDVARSSAYNIFNSGNVTVSGGNFFNLNSSQGANRTIQVSGTTGNADISSLNIYDSRTPALSYYLYESATGSSGSVWFHNITLNVPGGDGHDGLVLFSSSTSPHMGAYDLWPSVDLLNFPTSVSLLNGSRVYCSTCDTPSSPGATCTASGDHAGAQLLVARGANRCY